METRAGKSPLKYAVSALAQTSTGDLDISTGGLRVEQGIAQCAAWKLSNLFGFFKGEWFADQRQGVPYFQYVLVSNPNLPLIGNIFRRVCLSVPAVARVTEVTMSFLPRKRHLDVAIAAETDEGVKIVGGVGTPFIVQQQPNTGV